MAIWQFLFLLLGLSHNYSVSTRSMVPTFQAGDVIELRLTHLYGRFTLNSLEQPRIGDVVVFHSLQRGVNWIKRVVGVSGSHVQMLRGRLYVDGKLVPRSLEGQFTDVFGDGSQAVVDRYEETLPGGVEHEIDEISDSELLDDTDEFVVPSGSLFVMGDSRDDSADSRVPPVLGFVSVQDVVAIGHGPIFFWHHQP